MKSFSTGTDSSFQRSRLKGRNDGINFTSKSAHQADFDIKKKQANSQDRLVLIGRLLFWLILIAVAVVLGLVTNKILKESEVVLAEQQFSSIADRALIASYEIVVRKRLGAVSCASVIASAFPNARSWPFVALNGYETISTNIIEASSGREMALAPIVSPDQIEAFEQFAYNYYTRDRIPEFPDDTGTKAGVSQFGFGIWGKNQNMSNTTDQRYHVTDGSTNFNSSYNIVTPIIQHNLGAHPVLLLNIHFEKTRGRLIDHMIDCASSRREIAESNPNSTQYLLKECVSITDIITLVDEPGPGAIILQPIYPHNNDTVLTGLIATSIVWKETLQNVFSEQTSGVFCVLKTETLVYTYYIQKGVPVLLGSGDLHDRKFDEFQKHKMRLTGDRLFSQESGVYTLQLYPSTEFFDLYSTSNPMIATIGAVCIIIVMSLVFLLYDYSVRREFNSKQLLLDAKRRYMRYISHEVRFTSARYFFRQLVT